VQFPQFNRKTRKANWIVYEKLKEIRKIALDAIRSIKVAASDAIASARAHADGLPPQRRARIIKAAKYAGIAAVCVGAFVWFATRDEKSNVTELQK